MKLITLGNNYVLEAMWDTYHVLDIHYWKYDLRNIKSESKHLSEEEHAMLHNILSKYAFLSEWILYNWKKTYRYRIANIWQTLLCYTLS